MTKHNRTETDARTIRRAGYWAALYQAQTAALFLGPGSNEKMRMSVVNGALREVRRFAVIADESPEHFIKLATSDWEGKPDERREQALALFASLDMSGEE